MAAIPCATCRYPHPQGQVCPERLFEIRLGMKESSMLFGTVTLKFLNTDSELSQALDSRYRERVGVFTRSTRVYSRSAELYTKTRGGSYDILEAEHRGSRSADIIRWQLRPNDQSTKTLYIEETLCSKRLSILALIVIFVSIVGSIVFVAYRGYDAATQNWIAAAVLIYTVVAAALAPLVTRKLKDPSL